MATLASLVVSLEANVARFESDLNKAEFMAKKPWTPSAMCRKPP